MTQLATDLSTVAQQFLDGVEDEREQRQQQAVVEQQSLSNVAQQFLDSVEAEQAAIGGQQAPTLGAQDETPAIEATRNDELFQQARQAEIASGQPTNAPLRRFNQIRAQSELPPLEALPPELIADTSDRAINALKQTVRGFAETANRAIEGVGDLVDVVTELVGIKFDPPSKFFEESRNVIRAFLPDDPRLRQEFLSSQLPAGLGSAAGFFALGATGGVPGVVAGGVTLGAQEQAETARQAGIEGVQKALATTLGGVLGLTETALPLRLARVLKPIDRAVRGKLFSAILSRGGLPGDVAIEAMQELGQQAGSNLIAKHILKLDRPLTQGLVESGEVGGGVGLIFGGLARLAGIKLRKFKSPEAQAGAEQGEQAVSAQARVQPTEQAPEPSAVAQQATQLAQAQPEAAQRLIAAADKAVRARGPQGVPSQTDFIAEGVTGLSRDERGEFVRTIRKEVGRAKEVRGDTGQPSEAGRAPSRGKDTGGADIQQKPKAKRKPSDKATQAKITEEARRQEVLAAIAKGDTDAFLFHASDLQDAQSIELSGFVSGGFASLRRAQQFAGPQEDAFVVFKKSELPKNLRRGVEQFSTEEEARELEEAGDQPVGIVGEALTPFAVVSRAEVAEAEAAPKKAAEEAGKAVEKKAAPSAAKPKVEVKPILIRKEDVPSKTFSQMRKPRLGGSLGPQTFIKKFIQTIPGFKENPEFTVRDGKLVHKDGGTFRLEPSLLGLEAAKLKEGQKVRLDLESFGVRVSASKATKPVARETPPTKTGVTVGSLFKSRIGKQSGSKEIRALLDKDVGELTDEELNTLTDFAATMEALGSPDIQSDGERISKAVADEQERRESQAQARVQPTEQAPAAQEAAEAAPEDVARETPPPPDEAREAFRVLRRRGLSVQAAARQVRQDFDILAEIGGVEIAGRAPEAQDVAQEPAAAEPAPAAQEAAEATKSVPHATKAEPKSESPIRSKPGIPDPLTIPNDPSVQASPRPHPMPTRLESPKGAVKAIAAPEVIDSFVRIIRAFNVKAKVPIRVGRIGKVAPAGIPALGVFKLPSAVIRIRQANDLTTAAHEVGHAIEYAVFGHPKTGLFAAEVRRTGITTELDKLGRDLYGDEKPNGGYVREGFADFVRFYLTDPVAAKAKAPKTLRVFEQEFLAGRLLARKMLIRARESAQRFAEQGSISRALQSVVDPLSARQRLKRIAESTKRATSFQTHVDALDPIFVFTKEAESMLGRKLEPSESPAFAASALRQTEAARLEQMIERGMIDFAGNPTGGASLNQIGALLRGKRNRQKFTVYLWAKRAEALWLDPNKPEGRNPGLTLEDAQQIIKELDSPNMQLAAGKFYDWWDGVMNYAGQASPTFAQALVSIRAADPGYYIPLQREFRELDRFFASGASSARRGTLSRRLVGSGRRILDPIPQSLKNARAIISSAHKRYVLDTMLKLSKVEGLGHLMEKVPRAQVPVAARTIKDLVAEIDKRIKGQGGTEKIGDSVSEDVLEEVVTFFTSEQTAKRGEPIIPIVEEGKLVFYQVDPRLFDALNHLENINLRQIHWAAEWFGRKPAQMFRLGTTGLRASFGLVTNPARDVQTLWVNSQANANGFQLFYSWMRSMISSALQTTTGKRDPYFDAFMRLGGQMAQPLFFDVDVSKRAARKVFQGRVVQVADPRNWVNWMRELIQIPESATRVAEFRLIARDVGWKPGQPMSLDQSFRLLLASKQVTVDFTAAGTFAANVNMVVPFYNAAIQGPRANLRAMRRNPTKFMIRALTGLTIPTLLLWWRNKDEEWYKEMPAKEKALFWHIEFGDNTLFRFPRSFEIGQFFAAAPEAMLDSWYRTDPEAVKEWFPVAFEVLTPDIRPVLVRETIQQLRNFDDFWDRPIVSERLKRKPPQEQVGPYTSRVAQLVGDMFKVSPQRVDHAIRGIGGGVATDIISVVGLGPKEIDRQPEAADIFLLGRMFSRGGRLGGRLKSVTKMYDLLDAAQTRQASDRIEETEQQGQRRLLLTDAARAVSNLLYVRSVTPSKDRRSQLSAEALAIAKDAVKTIETGERLRKRAVSQIRERITKRKKQTEADRAVARFRGAGATSRSSLMRMFRNDWLKKHPKTRFGSSARPAARKRFQAARTEFRRALRDAGIR